MDKHKVACPICQKDLPLDIINKHIDQCLSSHSDSLDDVDSEECVVTEDSPPKKRCKVDKDLPRDGNFNLSKSADVNKTCMMKQTYDDGACSDVIQRPRARASSMSVSPLNNSQAFAGNQDKMKQMSLFGAKKNYLDSKSTREKPGPTQALQPGDHFFSKAKPVKPKVIGGQDHMQSHSQKRTDSYSFPTKPPAIKDCGAKLEVCVDSFPAASASATTNRPRTDLSQPLAERLRPKTLDEYVGQAEVLGRGSMMRVLLEASRIPSMLLWGPPGCGKVPVLLKK
jgi:hypothetical protein